MNDAVTIHVGPVPTIDDRPGLFLLDDLEDAQRTRDLTDSDRSALRAVADWIESFIIQPHRDLGRAGPVCPFTGVAVEGRTLWLAPEHSAGRGTAEVVELVGHYKQRLLSADPADGDGADYKSIVVIFPDLPAAQANDFFAGLLDQIGVSSYVDEGLVMGPFYAGNDGTAIYNMNFRPFQSPVPLLLIRRAVISDWKFFLNDATWLGLWARRYGQDAIEALAEELRRLPWNARRDATGPWGAT